MGLFRLLASPVTGPIAATGWVADVLLREAERELYDVEALQEQIEALQTRRELGQVDDDEFEREEEDLWERLFEAREYHRQLDGGG